MKMNLHCFISLYICVVTMFLMTGCTNMGELGTNLMNGIDIGLGAVNKGLRSLNESMAEATGQRQPTSVNDNTQTNNMESATNNTYC